MPDESRPLILTLKLDQPSFERLDALRREHFPVERNFLPAHLTLFHHLPGGDPGAIAATLRGEMANTPPPNLRAIGWRFLGKGVAQGFDAPALVAFRARLAARWSDHLTPQDRQPPKPHVTIQNKADPAAARALFQRLQAMFEPFDATGEGVLLWRYLGGPWEPLGEFPFAVP
ncbi:hypothetical protein N825_16615 [Skermanella stibiiresistens SB22]|uniref:Phosphoesterase HXTX n=1 Tax=Skermanella stibiiresistens SB22 TaxID=1385369 RepID=W9GV66_9PROT|nr:2'-5' RNA ligase family protein [Skermanella stibiiresistens]EWY37674.1 hypothetical protein N825_16615 [Skermanella stibiiresistens SB22]